MGRPTRADPKDGWHHVMNRGVDRQAIFLDVADRVEFGQRLNDLHERFDIETHAYCLMDNHFHLLLHCPDGGLSAAMPHLGSVFTRHINDRHQRDGPLLRGRFHSRLVTDESYLLMACRSIHRNPLDRRDVDDVSASRWSSHRTYLGHRPAPPWMKVSTVLRLFGGDVDAFDAFVRTDARTDAHRPSIDEIRRLASVAELAVVHHAADHGIRSGSLAGVVALLALDEMPECPDADVVVALGAPNLAAVTAARRRSRIALENDPSLAGLVDTLLPSIAVYEAARQVSDT